jgi:hypothetical protein
MAFQSPGLLTNIMEATVRPRNASSEMSRCEGKAEVAMGTTQTRIADKLLAAGLGWLAAPVLEKCLAVLGVRDLAAGGFQELLATASV